MPIYEYVCSACDHRCDIFHGLHDPGPHFCPSCGREGTMRKAFAPPTIVFKGSGWARKDRGATSSPRSSRSEHKSDSSSGDSHGDGAGSSGSEGKVSTSTSGEAE